MCVRNITTRSLVTVRDTYMEIIPILVETMVNLTNLEKKLYLCKKKSMLRASLGALFSRGIYIFKEKIY